MAPERLGDGDVEHRADVDAVGVMLRELLTGRPLWQGLGEVDILRERLARKIPQLPANVALAPELREVLDRSTAPEPSQRARGTGGGAPLPRAGGVRWKTR